MRQHTVWVPMYVSKKPLAANKTDFFTLENISIGSQFKGISKIGSQEVRETLQWMSLDLGGGKTE